MEVIRLPVPRSHMPEYFGGVLKVQVPDQLRCAVSRPCRDGPKIQRSYEALAEHYGTAVIPARPNSVSRSLRGSLGLLARLAVSRIHNDRPVR